MSIAVETEEKVVARTIDMVIADMELACKQYTEARLAERPNQRTIESIDAQINAYRAEENDMAKRNAYAEIRKYPAEDRLVIAAKTLSYITHVPKDVMESSTTSSGNKTRVFVRREVVEREVFIDPFDLNKFCETTGASAAWVGSCQKLNQRCVLRVAKELKLPEAEIEKISTTYYMKHEVEGMQNGKTPTSNTAMLTALTGLFAEMFGEAIDKPRSQDVAFMIAAQTRRGRNALEIATAKHAEFGRMMLAIAHGIIEKKGYTLTYEVKKDR